MSEKIFKILLLLFLLSHYPVFSQQTLQKYIIEMDGHDCSGSSCKSFYVRMHYPQVYVPNFYKFVNRDDRGDWIGAGDTANTYNYQVRLNFRYNRHCGRSGNYPRIHIFHNNNGQYYRCGNFSRTYPCNDPDEWEDDNAVHVIDFKNGHAQDYTIPENTYITMWIYTECTESDITITAGCPHNFDLNAVGLEYVDFNEQYHREKCGNCQYIFPDNLPHVADKFSWYHTDDGKINYLCEFCNRRDSCKVHSLLEENKASPYENLYNVTIRNDDDTVMYTTDRMAEYVYAKPEYSVVNTDNSTKNASDPPYISFYIPQNGSFSIGFKNAIPDFYKNLSANENGGKIVLFGQSEDQGFTVNSQDKLYFVSNPGDINTLVYEHNVETNQGSYHNFPITKSDNGIYNEDQVYYLKEVNRYGLKRYHAVKFRYCDVFPAIELSARQNTKGLSLVSENYNGEKNNFNTIFQGFSPNFNLDFKISTKLNAAIAAHEYLLEPFNSLHSFKIEKQSGSAWTEIGTYPSGSFNNENFTAHTHTDIYSLTGILQSSDGNDNNTNSILSRLTAAGENTDIVRKYRLTVTARNRIGNLGSGSACFYLDYGVKASPRLSWEYNLPVKPEPIGANYRVPGKTTGEEIDFNALFNENHDIVHLKISDENFITKEGFRGGDIGALENKAKIFLKIIPGDAISDDNSLFPGTDFAVSQSGSHYAYSIALRLKHFLWQKGASAINPIAEDNNMTVERIIDTDSEEQYFSRGERIPVNIWNSPFKLSLVYRDWIGNEYIPAKHELSAADCDYYFPEIEVENDGVVTTILSEAIHTPAYCPDIDLTTVYIKDSGRMIDGVPEVLNPQANLTELAITILPSFQDFTYSYIIDVFNQANANIFSSSCDLKTEETDSNLVKIDNGLLYKNDYRFEVKAVNANGYVTEPANEFIHNLDRDDLTIDAGGELIADETIWNWRYRLKGDVIVPADRALMITPGGSVKTPKVYSDRKAKIIVKSGGKLVIDGSHNIADAGPFIVSDQVTNKNAFVNLAPSGLDTRLDDLDDPESIYQFDGENNWGGIYLEKGYHPDSKIIRARITGAYDGLIVFGAGSDENTSLLIEDSLFMSNYIGLHLIQDSDVRVLRSVIGSHKEYGIKTDGNGYKIDINEISNSGMPNRYGDYYTGKKNRCYSFEKLCDENNPARLSAEQGGN